MYPDRQWDRTPDVAMTMPDLILENANVLTFEPGRPRARAVAVRRVAFDGAPGDAAAGPPRRGFKCC